MALTITRLTAPAPNPKITVNARLFRTADNKRLVGEGHPDAAFLFCTPDDEVDAAEFGSYQLDPGIAGEPVAEVKAEAQPEDKGAKAPPEDKGAIFPPKAKRQKKARRK